MTFALSTTADSLYANLIIVSWSDLSVSDYANINFGDGKTSRIYPTKGQVAHTYNATGTYTITATDTSGNTLGTTSVTVSSTPAPDQTQTFNLGNLNVSQAAAASIIPPTLRAPKWPQASSVITTFQTGHGWTSSGTGATFNLNDTTAGGFITGSQCATATTGGAGAQTNIRKFAGTVPDTTDKAVRLRIKVDDTTHLNELDFYVGSSSLGANYKWSFFVAGGSTYFVPGQWTTVTLNFANATTTGSPTRNNQTDLQLQIWDDNTGNAVTVHIQSVELIPDATSAFANGVCSICFDDSYSSARDLAFNKLDSLGYPATLFTITDVVGASNRLSVSDIKDRVDRWGWESACHAYTDANHSSSYTGLTAKNLETDIINQRVWLHQNGIKTGDGTAYPLGQFGQTSDAQATRDIVRRYFGYARTTHSRTTETFPPADVYKLRAYSSISAFSGGITPTSLTTSTTGTIDKAKTDNAWLILVFHKITSGAATSTSECQQSDFNAIVDKLNSAGMAVATISDVLRYY